MLRSEMTRMGGWKRANMRGGTAGRVERFGHVALRSGALAEEGHRCALLAAQLEGQRHPMRRVRADRDAVREILAGPGEPTAPRTAILSQILTQTRPACESAPKSSAPINTDGFSNLGAQ